MSNFKIVVTGIFAVCIVVAIAIFALSKASSGTNSYNLVVWGTVSDSIFDAAYKASSLNNNKEVKISYVRKDEADFDTDFVEALAEGRGPDIIILREDSLYKHRNKIFAIPYKNYSERNFKDLFIEEGEMFLTTDGVLSVPFIVDPLVLYWNRDMFSNALVSQPPKYWEDIFPLISKMTRKDSNANVLQSAVALGGWSNINNAKEIISMILMQAGTPITSRTEQGVVSVLDSTLGYTTAPGQSALNFYTQFSNPNSDYYTWNRSLPTSLNFFLSGNLSMYLGFASEIFSIQQKNSNLNFDVTTVPQVRTAAKKIVFGHMYALSIVKQSRQIPGAFLAVTALTEPASIKAVEAVTNLPPVRRDLLADRPSDAFRSVFYNSALVSHSWIDPNPVQSAMSFRDMIESITSGRNRLIEALSQASQELNAQLK